MAREQAPHRRGAGRCPVEQGTCARLTQTYILKAHILSGTPSSASGTDFAWLTREELQERWLAQDTPDARASWNVVQDLLDA